MKERVLRVASNLVSREVVLLVYWSLEVGFCVCVDVVADESGKAGRARF